MESSKEMKIEKEVSIESLPQEISKTISDVKARLAEAESKFQEVHQEKIYDSYNKVENFRRTLYEIDLLSQNLMEAYKLYAAYASHLMNLQDEGAYDLEQSDEEA